MSHPPPPLDVPSEASARSPLWMVTREPLLTQLVESLYQASLLIQVEPDGRHTLTFSRSHLESVRDRFAATIRRGEEKLHRLCELLGSRWFEAPCDLESVVVGEIATTRERFTLSQRISRDDLYATTDIDLGNRLLRRLQLFDGNQWSGAALVANFVEYQPTEPNLHGLHKIISRIKAEEEIWNKVADEIFNLDALVRRDKKLRHMSRFVKDVFGLKMVVGSAENAHALHQELMALEWRPDELRQHHVPVQEVTRRLETLEVKDYTGEYGRKDSGWEAIKLVVRWWEDTFEIQVQTLHKYREERERLSRESHAGFKAQRDHLREETARAIPLFGFYRDLLSWLFRAAPGEPAPTFPNVAIVVNP